MKKNIFMAALISITALVACSLGRYQTNASTPTSPATKGNLSTSPIPKTEISLSEQSTLIVHSIHTSTLNTNETLPLSESTNIIVKDELNSELSRIDNKGHLIKIPGIQPNVYLDAGIKISPNQSQFLYISFKSKLASGEAKYDLWISSVDGLNQAIILSDLTGGFNFDWLDQQNAIVWYPQKSGLSCPQTISIINAVTLDRKIIPPGPNIETAYCYPYPLFNEDHTKAIMQGRNENNWFLVDYLQNRTEEFRLDYPLLKSSIPWIFYKLNKNKLSIVVPSLDHIYFGQDLSVPNGGHKLSSINLPKTTSISENNLLTWDSNKMFVVFDLIEEHENTKSLATINLKTEELTNYTLDRSIYNSNVGYPSTWAYFSKDSRFLGWTVYTPPYNHPPLGITILDLQTGLIQFIDGYEILGFGENIPVQ